MEKATYQTNMGPSTRRPDPGPAHNQPTKSSWGATLPWIDRPQALGNPLSMPLASSLHVAPSSYSPKAVAWWIRGIFHQNRPSTSTNRGRGSVFSHTPHGSNLHYSQDVESTIFYLRVRESWAMLKFRKSPRRSNIFLYRSFVRLKYFMYLFIISIYLNVFMVI
jgi:hypothetical protein